MRGLAGLILGTWLTFLALSGAALAQAERIGGLETMGQSMAAISGPDAAWDVMVIELPGGVDFIQFSTDLGGITLDFPVFTDRQRALAPAAEQFLITREIPGQWVELGDGVTLIGDFGPIPAAVGIVPEFIEAVFGDLPEGDVRFILIRY